MSLLIPFILKIIGASLVIIMIFITWFYVEKNKAPKEDILSRETSVASEEEKAFSQFSLNTSTAKASIDLNKVLSGGPGKDGIPALINPKFTSIDQADIESSTLGVLVDIGGKQKFYPYSILTWHEVVNDQVGDQEVAVTFCPLCGSGIVFNRRVEGKILEFGVSGLLFESNLLMYDQKTESLWSQARGEAVVGELTGFKLQILPMQLITFSEVKDKYPRAMVLSTETGYERDYKTNPYSGYSDSEDLFFPVSVSDERLPAKELMYIVPLSGQVLAIERSRIKEGQTEATLKTGEKVVINRNGGEIEVVVDGKVRTGYFEMWFSFVTHHQDDGVLLEI